jgi:hypothetical protein
MFKNSKRVKKGVFDIQRKEFYEICGVVDKKQYKRCLFNHRLNPTIGVYQSVISN